MQPQSQVADFLNELVHQLYSRAATVAADPSAPRGNLANVPVFEHPRDVDWIVKNPALFRKNFSLISALGFSRFNTNEPEWSVRRDMTQPAYLAAARPRQQDSIRQVYEDQVSIANPSPSELEDAVFRASITVFLRALGVQLEPESVQPALVRLRHILARLQFFSWMTPSLQHGQEAVQAASAIVGEFAEVLDVDPNARELLARFASTGTGIGSFSPAEEFVMNLFAGVETTTATAMWLIDRIGANAAVQERIRQELSSGSDSPYADCFINETMRYFPPIPFLIREVAEDCEVAGRAVMARQLVLISIVGVHHHPEFWQDPQVFHAARPEFLDSTYDRRAFIPFLAGPRMCGGARLGRLEVQEALRVLVKHFNFVREDNGIVFDYALALRPGPAPIRIERRPG